MEKRLRILSIIGTVGMCLVLLMGATVTDTASGEGCGRSWPLCRGNFLPESVRESVIEFSHRMITGIIGIVIMLLAIGCWRARAKYPQLVPLIPIMVGALLLQSGMGAWAVKYPQSAPVLALHFGFSLVAVAGVFLVMRVIDDYRDGRMVARPAAPKSLSILYWIALVDVYVVAYSGAYIKHADAQDACRTWPLCDGQVWPGFQGDDGVVFMHRIAALGSILLVSVIARIAYMHRAERRDLYNVSMLALLVILCQAIVGAVVVASDMQLATTLMHAGLMTSLFLTVCEGCRICLPLKESSTVWAGSATAHPSAQPAD